MNKKAKYNEDGRCPLCGSCAVKYDGYDKEGEDLWYGAECEDCGAQWDECYKVSFDSCCNIRNIYGAEFENK